MNTTSCMESLLVDNIPCELKALPQWVCWKAEHKNNRAVKIPVDPKTGSYASSTNPDTWSDFATVLNARDIYHADGIGFVLDGGYVGIDLDDCIDDNGLIRDPEIESIFNAINSYTELSPSGKGLHIIAKGRLPENGKRKDGVEMYQSGRYLTVTGRHWEGSPNTIENRSEEVLSVYDSIWTDKTITQPDNTLTKHDSDDNNRLEKAFESKNGDAIKSLWEGKWEGKYQSKSEADIALCNHLGYWLNNDPNQIDKHFRQSGLYSDKWDRDDYRRSTIQKAISLGTTSFIHYTDLGNAKRMVAKYGQGIRYCHKWGIWLMWDGKRWSPDTLAKVEQMAKDTMLSMYDEAKYMSSDDERRKLLKHALSSESKRRIHDMLSLVKTEPGIAIDHKELDRDNDLLNVKNGTLNLRTGILQPHSRVDLITKIIDVPYDTTASCPKWDAFLSRIMSGNNNLISFLQRSLGYSMTGDTGEHVLFFMYGTGANGKSTFAETIMTLLGDYAQKAPTSMLTVKKNEGIPNDIARLVGVRFVTVAEVEDGKRLAESVVKDLTGGDKMTARFMRQEWFEFVPTHKLWIYGNHEPIIRGTDYGMWRRIKKIPFNVTIPEEEQNKRLKDELQQELPGILAWMVKGCMEWKAQGLLPPKEVQMATNQYKENMDVIGMFLNECCQKDTGVVLTGELYRAFQAWTTRNGEYCHTQTKFSQSLKERGYVLDKQAGNRVVKGIRLVNGA